MDTLWAPWRIAYVSKVNKAKTCIFCRAVRHHAADYVVFQTKYSLCMLNIFPYNNGHLMVCPRRHTKQITRLSQAEVLDVFNALVKAQGILTDVLKPQGFNIGINLERAAGAGITGHLHIHIVPRWQGDTNFMPVVHKTKVISESLTELHKRLKDAYAKTNR